MQPPGNPRFSASMKGFCGCQLYTCSLAEAVSSGSRSYSAEPGGSLAQLAQGMLAAVKQGHSLGIVHRDIKPANIMLSADGVPFLGDYGSEWVYLCGALQLPMQQVIGTPLYMSPQVLTGRYGKCVDLWSLGVTVMNLLLGMTLRSKCGPETDVRQRVAEQLNLFVIGDPSCCQDKLTMQLRDARVLCPRSVCDFVAACCGLGRYQHKRSSVEQLKQHPWLTGRRY